MKYPSWLLPCLLVLTVAARADYAASWIDPDTGHKIVQLSQDPHSESLYFTQYSFTAGGTKLVFTVRGGNIDLVTLATGAVEHVYEEGGARVLQTGRKTGAIFYTKGRYLYALDPVTKVSKQLIHIPDAGNIAAINCDETLATGTIVPGEASRPPINAVRAQPKTLASGVEEGDIPSQVDKHAMMDRRLAAMLPTTLFVINLQTGAITELRPLHRLDEPPAVLPDGPDAADVRPRGPAVEGGPHLADPGRRPFPAHAGPPAHDEDGDRRP